MVCRQQVCLLLLFHKYTNFIGLVCISQVLVCTKNCSVNETLWPRPAGQGFIINVQLQSHSAICDSSFRTAPTAPLTLSSMRLSFPLRLLAWHCCPETAVMYAAVSLQQDAISFHTLSVDPGQEQVQSSQSSPQRTAQTLACVLYAYWINSIYSLKA